MDETLEQRLTAIERTLTDGEHDLSALAADGDLAERVERLESDRDDLAERVDELEAATQALRGYVGQIRAVNEEVRERADLALEMTREQTSSTPDDEREVDEPTLEIGANDGDSPTHRDTEIVEDDLQSSDDRCPLCDGERDGAGTQHNRRHSDHRSDAHQMTDEEKLAHRESLTDGGVGPDFDDGDDPNLDVSDEAGLLRRVRTLL